MKSVPIGITGLKLIWNALVDQGLLSKQFLPVLGEGTIEIHQTGFRRFQGRWCRLFLIGKSQQVIGCHIKIKSQPDEHGEIRFPVAFDIAIDGRVCYMKLQGKLFLCKVVFFKEMLKTSAKIHSGSSSILLYNNYNIIGNEYAMSKRYMNREMLYADCV